MSHYLWLEKKRDASWLWMAHEFDLELINNSPAVRKTPTGYTDFGDGCWWQISLFRAPTFRRRCNKCHQHKKCHQLNPASLSHNNMTLILKTSSNQMIWFVIVYQICSILYAAYHMQLKAFILGDIVALLMQAVPIRNSDW